MNKTLSNICNTMTLSVKILINQRDSQLLDRMALQCIQKNTLYSPLGEVLYVTAI